MELLDLLTTYSSHPNVGGTESKAKEEEDRPEEKKVETEEKQKEEEPIFVYNQGIGRRGLYHKYQDHKKEIPSFSCDGCNRFFHTQDELNKHCLTHTPCPQSGCTFVGNAKAHKFHFERVHTPNSVLSKYKLDTPEDIAKWVEERKKNWPSEQNRKRKLEEKAKAQQEPKAKAPKLSKAKAKVAAQRGSKEKEDEDKKVAILQCFHYIATNKFFLG